MAGLGESGQGSGAAAENAVVVVRNPSILSRVNECMSRQGRDFVRDEYMAILMTLDPAQDANAIADMTVDSLRKSIRAAVVVKSTSTRGEHNGAEPQEQNQDPA